MEKSYRLCINNFAVTKPPVRRRRHYLRWHRDLDDHPCRGRVAFNLLAIFAQAVLARRKMPRTIDKSSVRTYTCNVRTYVISCGEIFPMRLTASKLRQEVYKILDEIIRTGKPAEIERNGNLLKIVSVSKRYSKLSKLKPRKLSNEDSDNFEHIDWTQEWKPR